MMKTERHHEECSRYKYVSFFIKKEGKISMFFLIYSSGNVYVH